MPTSLRDNDQSETKRGGGKKAKKGRFPDAVESSRTPPDQQAEQPTPRRQVQVANPPKPAIDMNFDIDELMIPDIYDKREEQKQAPTFLEDAILQSATKSHRAKRKYTKKSTVNQQSHESPL